MQGVLKWPAPLRWHWQAQAAEWMTQLGGRPPLCAGWLLLAASFMGPGRAPGKKPAAVCLDGFHFGACVP